MQREGRSKKKTRSVENVVYRKSLRGGKNIKDKGEEKKTGGGNGTVLNGSGNPEPKP